MYRSVKEDHPSATMFTFARQDALGDPDLYRFDQEGRPMNARLKLKGSDEYLAIANDAGKSHKGRTQAGVAVQLVSNESDSLTFCLL